MAVYARAPPLDPLRTFLERKVLRTPKNFCFASREEDMTVYFS
jgi:hypothetical protein